MNVQSWSYRLKFALAYLPAFTGADTAWAQVG
jgi:hypothetical protein